MPRSAMRVRGCEAGSWHEKVCSSVLLRAIWMSLIWLGGIYLIYWVGWTRTHDFHKWRVVLGAVLAPPRVE